MRVIEGNNEALDFKGCSVLLVALGSNLIWHEFGDVPNLPLKVLVGADVLAPHFCSLLYLKNNKKRLQLGIEVCPRCLQHRTDPNVKSQKQLRFVDRSFKRMRNRLKVVYNFLANSRSGVRRLRQRATERSRQRSIRSYSRALICIRLTTLATLLLTSPWQLSP